MGQGGYITLNNKTSYDWTLSKHHEYQMNAWKFPVTIASGSSAKVYIEWDQDIFADQSNDAGDAYYSIGHTGQQFHIMARNNHGFNISIDMMNTVGKTLPALTTQKPPIVNLGFDHNGTLDFTLTMLAKT